MKSRDSPNSRNPFGGLPEPPHRSGQKGKEDERANQLLHMGRLL